MKLNIGGRQAGKDMPVLIIAEAGINHDGKLEQAIKLIDTAKEAGADIVKFQLFKAEKMYTESAGNYVTAAGKKVGIVELLKSVELPYHWIPKLIDHCNSMNIGFLCTVCDENSGDILDQYGVDAFKMESSALTHIPLMQHMAKKNKTIVISSGAAKLSEIDIAIEKIREAGNNSIGLLYCLAKYPTPINRCNLNVIETLVKAYPDVVVGYSDHTEEPAEAPVVAVYKGAKIIEKHITIDKKLPGADHCFALDPSGLKEMVKAIRQAERDISENRSIKINNILEGTSEKRVLEEEEYIRRFAYRCLFAVKDIKQGETIHEDNVKILRPGESERGIEPIHYYMLLRHKVKANKDIKKGLSIKWEDILNL